MPAIMVAIVVAAILAAMFLAWRARSGRVAGLSLPALLTDPGEPLFRCSRVFYVATTLASQPLERIPLVGLKYRGFADIEASTTGIVVSIAGERPTAIERSLIQSVKPQQLTIDKVVEPGGLIGIEWESKLGPLVSVFRVQNAAARADLLSLNPTDKYRKMEESPLPSPSVSPNKEN